MSIDWEKPLEVLNGYGDWITVERAQFNTEGNVDIFYRDRKGNQKEMEVLTSKYHEFGHFLRNKQGLHIERPKGKPYTLDEITVPISVYPTIGMWTEPKVYEEAPTVKNALDEQVGGGHYKGFAIQPIEFIHKNNLGFIEGNIIKYICREESKGKREDLLKVIHYARMLLELKYGVNSVFHEGDGPKEMTGFIATLSEEQKEAAGLIKPKLTLPLEVGKKYGVQTDGIYYEHVAANIGPGDPWITIRHRTFNPQTGKDWRNDSACYVKEGPLD